MAAFRNINIIIFLCFATTVFAQLTPSKYNASADLQPRRVLAISSGELGFFDCGQSNDDGRADTLEYPVYFRNKQVGNRIYRSSLGVWDSMSIATNQSATHDGDWGILYCHQISHYAGFRVSRVKYAIGGTTMCELTGFGEWSPFQSGSRTNTFITRVNASQTTGGLDADVYFLAFDQGESDALYDSCATNYNSNLSHWVDTVRTKINMPVIEIGIVGVNRALASPYIYATTVNDAQTAVVAAGSNLFFYQTNGFPLQDDVHFDYAGCRDIARSMLGPVYKKRNKVLCQKL